jgi:hypothetical protein
VAGESIVVLSGGTICFCFEDVDGAAENAIVDTVDDDTDDDEDEYGGGGGGVDDVDDTDDDDDIGENECGGVGEVASNGDGDDNGDDDDRKGCDCGSGVVKSDGDSLGNDVLDDVGGDIVNGFF